MAPGSRESLVVKPYVTTWKGNPQAPGNLPSAHQAPRVVTPMAWLNRGVCQQTWCASVQIHGAPFAADHWHCHVVGMMPIANPIPAQAVSAGAGPGWPQSPQFEGPAGPRKNEGVAAGFLPLAGAALRRLRTLWPRDSDDLTLACRTGGMGARPPIMLPLATRRPRMPSR